MRQTMYRSRFSDTWHTRDDDMRYVSILCNDLQPINGIGVADNIVQKDWAIFLDPFKLLLAGNLC